MKITNLKVHILKPWKPVPELEKVGVEIARLNAEGLVRLFTDEDIEGNFLVRADIAEEVARRFFFNKRYLVGVDPFKREKIWKTLAPWPLYWPHRDLYVLDACIWDIMGKALGLPIYKLMGGYREKILAYASTQHYNTDEEYVELALECKRKGYKAFKIHPYYGDWMKGLGLYRAVREAVGDDMYLMADPANTYDREGAIRVGRELDKLNYYWFEDPIPTTDVSGLVDLCRSLDLEILMGEDISSPNGYTELIRRQATDGIRSYGLNVGGLTPLIKVAHLADLFNMKFEPECWGNTFAQAVHLHSALAVKNCDFFEKVVPEEDFEYATKNVIRIDKEGYVHALEKPGIGIDIDWNLIEKMTIKTLP